MEDPGVRRLVVLSEDLLRRSEAAQEEYEAKLEQVRAVIELSEKVCRAAKELRESRTVNPASSFSPSLPQKSL